MPSLEMDRLATEAVQCWADFQEGMALTQGNGHGYDKHDRDDDDRAYDDHDHGHKHGVPRRNVVRRK